jgi:hypothetical protein
MERAILRAALDGAASGPQGAGIAVVLAGPVAHHTVLVDERTLSFL